MGIEGSQFCTNPLLPSPCSCSTWVTSPLEHPLRNFRLSLTQAHLSCGCPPSFAPVQPVPCHSVFHPWDLMTPISCVCSYTSWFRHCKFSTFRPTQKTFRIAYGSGSMMGFLAYDTVHVMRKEKLSQNWLWSDHCLQQMQDHLAGPFLD